MQRRTFLGTALAVANAPPLENLGNNTTKFIDHCHSSFE